MINCEISKRGDLVGHRNPIYAVSVGASANRIYTAGNDTGVVEWDLNDMAFSRIVYPVKSSVYALLALSEGQLVVGERSGEISIILMESGDPVARLQIHQKPIFDLVTFDEGRKLIACSEDGSISVWDLRTHEMLVQILLADTTVRCASISPDGQWGAFGLKNGQVKILSLADFEVIHTLFAHELTVTSVCFSPDGSQLLTGGRDAKFQIFDTKGFIAMMDFVPHMYAVYSIVFHPTLPVFATSSRDKNVKIWSFEDFGLIKSLSRDKGLDAHRLSVNDLIWDLTGDRLISVSDDKLGMVWDIQWQQ